MDKNTLFFLIDKYLNGTATTEENALLDKYYERLEKTGTSNLSLEEKAALKEEMYRNILRDISKGSKVIPLYKRSIFRRVAAAASVLLLLSTGVYFLLINKQQRQIAQEQPSQDVAAPKATKAMITLSNGKTVALDSINSGTLITQGNVNVVKTADGEIVYNGSSNEVVYNTLNNPRGSQVVNLTLADGSRVWLNAGSSVTYPIAFRGSERKVQINGEAYFEVAHNAAMPFIVEKNDVSVQVLGTHFNVNTYDDEIAPKITLLEGSVKVSKGNKTSVLIPGQQAQLTNNEIKIEKADIEQVMAWKNGVFKFTNTNIETIMRQVSRWYDVDIIYKGNFGDLDFGGTVSRKANVSELLKRLEATEAVHFIVEGKKITVTK